MSLPMTEANIVLLLAYGFLLGFSFAMVLFGAMERRRQRRRRQLGKDY